MRDPEAAAGTVTLALLRMRLEDERIAWTVERICQLILDWQSREPLTTSDMVMALPLAIAQYIAMTTPAVDRRRQLATAEAVLRHLGRTCLSASYDRARLSRIVERCAADPAQSDGAQQAQSEGVHGTSPQRIA
jgi:hypothetical protein